MASLPFLHGTEFFERGLPTPITGLHNDSAARRQQQRNRGVEMSLNAPSGLIHLASQHSVEETMQRLETLLHERGVTIFARIDHRDRKSTRLNSSHRCISY